MPIELKLTLHEGTPLETVNTLMNNLSYLPSVHRVERVDDLPGEVGKIRMASVGVLTGPEDLPVRLGPNRMQRHLRETVRKK